MEDYGFSHGFGGDASDEGSAFNSPPAIFSAIQTAATEDFASKFGLQYSQIPADDSALQVDSELEYYKKHTEEWEQRVNRHAAALAQEMQQAEYMENA
jgi:hypothetical protein